MYFVFCILYSLYFLSNCSYKARRDRHRSHFHSEVTMFDSSHDPHDSMLPALFPSGAPVPVMSCRQHTRDRLNVSHSERDFSVANNLKLDLSSWTDAGTFHLPLHQLVDPFNFQMCACVCIWHSDELFPCVQVIRSKENNKPKGNHGDIASACVAMALIPRFFRANTSACSL